MNNADPRSPGAITQQEYYDYLYKDYADHNIIKNLDSFNYGLELRDNIDFNWLPEEFDDGTKGKSGLWSAVHKIEAAKNAGLTSYEGTKQSRRYAYMS
ncbi:hypothetical protein [Breoghania sp. L-A4]|uniref:hypothetical protein n=1 Tax=Breoghania sp. L-A4 TaxID=2304600 RepID=UPI0013C33F6A|nr:hypothetical protein [Breoghania sp. L-A4]